ncbi:hypothetical protein K7432_008970 [Basidiobolus ranarum]|uniref:Uncharacterized protein n=1 Tax=Basidiobolus ranarum TaxID=34480 RepID=A0ABR2VXT9_9FUNG
MSNPTVQVVEEEKKGFMEEIWLSIFTPGVNGSVVKAMNLSFIASLVSLAFLAYSTGGDIHAIIVFVITSCLFVAVNLLVKELEKAKIAEASEEVKKEN